MRSKETAKLTSDGGDDGDPAKCMAEELKSSPVLVDTMELSNSASEE